MYTLIPKGKFEPREPSLFFKPDLATTLSVLARLKDDQPVAFDLETTSLNPREGSIVSIGIATSKGCAAIEVRDNKILRAVGQWLMEQHLYAYNMAFDGVWMATKSGEIPQIAGDTMIMFKLLANEGFQGQRHGLNDLIQNVLGWPVNNKNTLSEILAQHNLSKANMSKLLDIPGEEETFLHYNAMDAEATYQGMQYLRQLAKDKSLDTVVEVHDNLYATAYEVYIEQHVRGLLIDVEATHNLKAVVDAEAAKWEAKFLNHPKVKPYVDAMNDQLYQEHFKPVVSTKREWAKKSDEAWLKPDEWTKGDRPKPAKWEEEFGSYYRDITSVKASRKSSAPKQFSLTSPKDLQEFLYRGELFNYSIVREPNPDAEKPWERDGIVEIEPLTWEGDEVWPPITPPSGMKVHVAMTSSGSLPTGGKDALPWFGELGAIIRHFKLWKKRGEFINQLIEKVEGELLHPDLKMHGAITGRGSGGAEESDGAKFSMQQLPKRPMWKEFYGLFIARPGHKLLYLDFNSLEDVLMAEASQDPTFLTIYGSDDPHDGYLYLAMQIFPEGDEVSKVYYDNGQVTGDSVGAAKKQFKAVRNRVKPVKLGKNYGMGAKKLHGALQLSNVWLSEDEVKIISDNYDASVKGVAAWTKELEKEWDKRGGYILNGTGRPMCIPKAKLKDSKNRYIQSQGHDFLLTFVAFINQLRKERGVEMYPYHYDNHDATVWEVPDNCVEAARAIYVDALAMANEWMGLGIKIKGDVEVGVSLADFIS